MSDTNEETVEIEDCENPDYFDHEIKEAFEIMQDIGIYMHVPGCFDVTSPENAILYQNNRAEFLRMAENGELPLRQLKA